MTIKELKTGIINLLKTKYPTTKYKYYSMAVVENYSRPCFFTQIKPLEMKPENYNSRKNAVVFYITAMPEITKEEELLDMIQTVRDLFGMFVRIGDRAIKVTDFDWNYIGTYRNIPEISIELQWLDRIEHKNDAPLMERIETKKEWRN